MLFVFFFLALAPAVVFSCSCMPGSINGTFCGYDFVSHVKILTGEYDPPYIIHDVEHLEVFKDNGSMIWTLPSRLFTASSSAACGVTLYPGEEYLLSGQIRGSMLQTGSCNWLNRWDDISQEFIDSLAEIEC